MFWTVKTPVFIAATFATLTSLEAQIGRWEFDFAASDHGFVAGFADYPSRDFDPALDTMRIALALEERGAFEGREIRGFDLDNLGALFDVEPHDRHTASGDAFITAQIFIRLERMARKAGIDLATLIEQDGEETGHE